MVCDSNLKITNIVAKWPGSAHDAWMLQQSSLYNNFETGKWKGLLLGDSAYPCKNWLMVQYRNPSREEQFRFNAALTRTRVMIEHCFGVWKRRFAILHGEIRMTPEKAAKVIGACAILHNIAVDRKIPVDHTETDYLENQPAQVEFEGKESGFVYRDQIAANSFGKSMSNQTGMQLTIFPLVR